MAGRRRSTAAGCRRASLDDARRDGRGRTAAWMRASGQLGDDQLLQRCAVAYISDDLPTDTVMRAHPVFGPLRENGAGDHGLFAASLDHTIWFHAPLRADEWHLYDFSCHRYVGGRGLAIGHVFDEAGTHTATVAQEVLVRDGRRPRSVLSRSGGGDRRSVLGDDGTDLVAAELVLLVQCRSDREQGGAVLRHQCAGSRLGVVDDPFR